MTQEANDLETKTGSTTDKEASDSERSMSKTLSHVLDGNQSDLIAMNLAVQLIKHRSSFNEKENLKAEVSEARLVPVTEKNRQKIFDALNPDPTQAWELNMLIDQSKSGAIMDVHYIVMQEVTWVPVEE